MFYKHVYIHLINKNKHYMSSTKLSRLFLNPYKKQAKNKRGCFTFLSLSAPDEV